MESLSVPAQPRSEIRSVGGGCDQELLRFGKDPVPSQLATLLRPEAARVTSHHPVRYRAPFAAGTNIHLLEKYAPHATHHSPSIAQAYPESTHQPVINRRRSDLPCPLQRSNASRGRMRMNQSGANQADDPMGMLGSNNSPTVPDQVDRDITLYRLITFTTHASRWKIFLFPTRILRS